MKTLIFALTFFISSFGVAHAQIIEKTSDYVLKRENNGRIGYYDIKRIPKTGGGYTNYHSLNKEMTVKLDQNALNDKYYRTHKSRVNVRNMSGAVSRQTVSATNVMTVNKKAVWKGLYKNAKVGGKLAGRLMGGPIGWTYGAFQLADSVLVKGGWVYNPDKGNWERAIEPRTFIIILSKTRSGWPTLENQRAYDDKGLAQICADKDGCNRAGLVNTANGGSIYNAQISACSSTTIEMGGSLGTVQANTVSSDQCGFRGAGMTHTKVNRWYAKPVRYSGREDLTQEEFDKLIQPYSDAEPSPYVTHSQPTETTPPPSLKHEDVHVDSGSVVSTDPYFDRADGNVKQLRWTFHNDSSGSFIKETTVIRGDLSSTSPAVTDRTPTKVTENVGTDGNVHSKTETYADGSSVTTAADGTVTTKKPDGSYSVKSPDGSVKNYPATSTGQNTQPDSNTGQSGQPGSDPDDPPQPPKESFLCSIFPDILACDKMGEADEDMFQDFEVPVSLNETSWVPESLLPSNGVCPAPATANIAGYQLTIPYDHACKFMENIRFAVLAAFVIASAYVVFGGFRST